MDFAHLPDLCLLRIFSHLSPPDLFYKIPLVCRTWKRLAQEASRHTRSIAIIVGQAAGPDSDELARFQFNAYLRVHHLGTTTGPRVDRIVAQAFLLRGLSLAFCERLVKTFSGVTALEVLIGNERAETSALECMLNHWGPRLTRLSFWFPVCRGRTTNLTSFLPQPFGDFIGGLNRLKRLRVLTLFVRYAKQDTLDQFDLQIMPQLEQLDLTLLCSQEVFFRSLLSQGLEAGPERITLTNAIDIVELVELFTNLGQAHQLPVLAGKFRHLSVDPYTETSPYPILVAHFRHLQSLDLQENCRKFQDLSGPLSQLSQLHTLKLNYYVHATDPELPEPEENPPPRWCPLPSIRVFILECVSAFKSHNWLKNELNPAVLFPGLVYFYIQPEMLLLRCGACHPDEDGRTFRKLSDPSRKRILPEVDCLGAILEPFNGCPQLSHKILIGVSEDNAPVGWTAQEHDVIHPWWENI